MVSYLLYAAGHQLGLQHAQIIYNVKSTLTTWRLKLRTDMQWYMQHMETLMHTHTARMQTRAHAPFEKDTPFQRHIRTHTERGWGGGEPISNGNHCQYTNVHQCKGMQSTQQKAHAHSLRQHNSCCPAASHALHVRQRAHANMQVARTHAHPRTPTQTQANAHGHRHWVPSANPLQKHAHTNTYCRHTCADTDADTDIHLITEHTRVRAVDTTCARAGEKADTIQ
jgi:hypothetical protein|mmetsp:Transcript_3049/g.5850  ORF Transcript_3049/g.5850 Transcript_3049/m.5850 type:complete len:225 (+) Transcript_3049:858-1532(+)